MVLQETDEICNEIYCTESIVKEGEKLPDKTKLLLEKAQDINKVYDKNNTSLFINGCINVENNIKTIIELNENIKKCNNSIKILIKIYILMKKKKKFINLLGILKDLVKFISINLKKRQ